VDYLGTMLDAGSCNLANGLHHNGLDVRIEYLRGSGNLAEKIFSQNSKTSQLTDENIPRLRINLKIVSATAAPAEFDMLKIGRRQKSIH